MVHHSLGLSSASTIQGTIPENFVRVRNNHLINCSCSSLWASL